MPFPLTRITNAHQYGFIIGREPSRTSFRSALACRRIACSPMTTLWLRQRTVVRNSRADILEGCEQVSHKKSVFDYSRHRIFKHPLSKTIYSTLLSYAYIYIPPRLTRSENEHLAGLLVCSGYGFPPVGSANFLLGIRSGEILCQRGVWTGNGRCAATKCARWC